MLAGSRNRFLFFDAVGTLLRPHPDVVTVYQQQGEAHGSILTAEEIRRRFSELYSLHFPRALADREVLRTSEQLERQRWQQLVTELFDDAEDPDRLFTSLWDHFSRAENWELYPDVKPALQWLDEQQIAWGIASNFDRRLEQIVAAIPELAPARVVLTSASAGWSKPAGEFYHRAGKAALERLGADHLQLWMIGDNWLLDVEAARASGWRSFWLQRDEPSSIDIGQLASLRDLSFLPWELD